MRIRGRREISHLERLAGPSPVEAAEQAVILSERLFALAKASEGEPELAWLHDEILRMHGNLAVLVDYFELRAAWDDDSPGGVQ